MFKENILDIKNALKSVFFPSFICIGGIEEIHINDNMGD